MIGNGKCDRCIALGEIQAQIDDTYRDINIAIIQQDNYGVVLSEKELTGLCEEWEECVIGPCSCINVDEVDPDEIPF